MKFGKFITKHSRLILIISTLLLIPATIGYINTGVNYDILSYLPQNIGSTKGQAILDKKFNNAATSMLIIEKKSPQEVDEIKEKISKIDGVSDIISRSSLIPEFVPNEILPKELEDAFYSKDSTLLFVKFDNPAASLDTQEAVESIRGVVKESGYLSGISPTVKDTKDLTDKETPIYTAIAVALSFIVLVLFTKSSFIPLFFLTNIAYAIMYNMGTNFIFGNISYLTKAIAAVLQLAVTMDYSIFLYHRYEEERGNYEDHREAMAIAIDKTFNALSGSSLTTISGFLALVVMELSLGKDIGFVMVKGVIFGVLTCLIVLPSFILVFDRLIHKYQHKVVQVKFNKMSKFIATHHLAFLILAIVLLVPAIYGSQNYKVYYNLDRSLPRDLESVVSLNKLKNDYNMQSTHFVLLSDKVSNSDVSEMTDRLEKVEGVNSVLSKTKLTGYMIPDYIIPDKILDQFEKNGYQMIMLQSKYKVASDEVNRQIKEIKDITNDYDKTAYITGEAELTDDLTSIADKDFKNVNILSLSVVFIIIMLTLKSISLPIILILAIELAIQMNMAVPFYMGQTIPFVASIIIGTIQLGSTIDYSILMTTRWMEEIKKGNDRLTAVETSIRETSTSIITSAVSFIVATLGVGLYSKMEIVSVFGKMMARGAFFSMFVILFILPSLIYFASPLIIKTTRGLATKPESETKALMED